MNWRRTAEENFFKILSAITTLFIAAILFYIIVVILWKGVPSLSWAIVSQTPKGGYYFGKEGGILNAIIGSFYLAGGATVLAFILSLPIALFMNVYLVSKPKTLTSIRFFMDVLWGIPSIVFGAFGFTLMLYLGMRSSIGAGIFTVALMITPIMVRAMDEVLKTIPIGLMEASYSLGSTKTETAYKVFFKQALPGFITAILLAFGRGIGDAASVMFTAGYTDYIPRSLGEPAATLPLAIFFQLGSPIPEVQGRAFAAAVILTAIVLIISISARLAFKNKK